MRNARRPAPAGRRESWLGGGRGGVGGRYTFRMSRADGEQGERSAVQSVDRAVTILEILAARGEAGITEIAEELGVHKSTASRLVSALQRRGLLEQLGDRGKYALSFGIVRLAAATTGRMDLARLGQPTCQALAEVIGETVNLAVSDGEAAINVAQEFGTLLRQLAELGRPTDPAARHLGRQGPARAHGRARAAVAPASPAAALHRGHHHRAGRAARRARAGGRRGLRPLLRRARGRDARRGGAGLGARRQRRRGALRLRARRTGSRDAVRGPWSRTCAMRPASSRRSSAGWSRPAAARCADRTRRSPSAVRKGGVPRPPRGPPAPPTPPRS